MKILFATLLLAAFTTACSSIDKQSAHDKAKAEQAKKQLTVKNKLKCELKDDVRVIELSSASKVKLCEVHYTKSGDKERIASAERQVNYCDNVLGKVKSNLTTAGFKCEL